MAFGETAAAQAVGQTVEPAVKCGVWTFKILKRKFDRVKNLKKHILNLETEEKYLRAREEDIRTRIARNEGKMEMTRECATWLDDVVTMESDIKSLKDKYHGTNKWLCGLCPFLALQSLGSEALRKTQDIVILKDRMNLENSIMIPAAQSPPATIMKRHTIKLDNVPSLKDYVETLIDFLEDKNVRHVGIYGLPGVGKTTVLENLQNIVHERQLFDMIFWVDVPEIDGIKKIQQKIVHQLKLECIDINDSDQTASIVSTALENKRYLLLLDDVSSVINLDKVGVHKNHDHGKVVLACQERNHCIMTDDYIKIERLSHNDALELFRSIVGNFIDHPSIKHTARKLIKECAGTASVIKLMAQYLKNETNAALWKDTLYKLQSPSIYPVEQLSEVYKCFKFIYDKLHSEEKPCLLYLAFFPADYEIYQDYLIECWRAEQLICSEHKLEDSRYRGRGMLQTFTEKCLLEKGRKTWCYKLPVYFQRMALKVATEGTTKFLVAEGENFQEPTENKWEHVRRVSLICQQLHDLPERPQCCTISTLLLQNNASLTNIPEAFFGYMCRLRVLDLYDTSIVSLPASIYSLMCIKALYLNKCTQLRELPTQIGDLESLEILDVRDTGIHSLPVWLGQLGKSLRCLRVSFKHDFSIHNHVQDQASALIPSNLISKLSLLEELSIEVNRHNERWNQIADAITEEIASLDALTCLALFFPKTICVVNFVLKSKSWNRKNSQQGGAAFRSFNLLVGSHEADNYDKFDVRRYSMEKHLRFSAGRDIPDGISSVLYQATTFELVGHRFIKRLSDFGDDTLDGLEACIITDCQEMDFVIDGKVVKNPTLQYLQELHLVNLPKLSYIWHGAIKSGSLSKLTTLTLKHCHSIQKLLPQSQQLLGLLCQLQYLQIDDCSGIVELIENGNTVDTEFLPKLKKLELHDLPNLFAICQIETTSWLSLETLEINGCPELKQLPFSLHTATKLKVIRCTENWKNQLLWPDDEIRNRLENICSFTQGT